MVNGCMIIHILLRKWNKIGFMSYGDKADRRPYFFNLVQCQKVTPCPYCNNSTNKKPDRSGYANIPW